MNQKELIYARDVFTHVTKLEKCVSEYNTLLDGFGDSKNQVQAEPYLHEMQQRIQLIRALYDELVKIKYFCEEQRLGSLLEFVFAVCLYCAEALVQVDGMDYYYGSPRPLTDFSPLAEQLQWIRALL